jgi:hypothetical protein
MLISEHQPDSNTGTTFIVGCSGLIPTYLHTAQASVLVDSMGLDADHSTPRNNLTGKQPLHQQQANHVRRH